MLYLTTYSTHFIYGYMSSDIIFYGKGPLSERRFPLAPISSKDSYTSRGALAGTRTSSIGPQ